MFEYETYLEKKLFERHGIWENPIHLRAAYRRIKNKQRGEYRSSESIMSHLKDINMSWSMHLWYALGLAGKFFLLSLTAVAHGMLPFIFTSKVSSEVNKLNEELS